MALVARYAGYDVPVKVECPCGHLISDSTDYIPYKATLIADQDRFDMLDEIAAAAQRACETTGTGDPTRLNDAIFRAVASMLRAHERAAYACSQCGRVLIQKRGEDNYEYESLSPDAGTDSRAILRSKKHSRWRGSMGGHWGSGALSKLGGSIWWECGDGEGAIEEFSTWEQLESRYHELLDVLQTRDVLRGSFLKKDGEVVHEWPSKS